MGDAVYFNRKKECFIAMDDYQGETYDNQCVLGERFSMILVESGSGIATVDDKKIPYIAPCVFCINEKEHIQISEEEGLSLWVFAFHPNIINSYFTFENIRNLPEDIAFTILQDNDLIKYFLERPEGSGEKFTIGPFSLKRIKKLFEGIHSLTCEQNSPNWPCRSRSYAMEALFLLESLHTADDFTKDTYTDTIEEEFYPILMYVNQNYNNKITVADITNRFHLSKPTLAKMFQENLGETFIAYLNKLRVTMAATMLRDTLLPVYEIMERVGFNDNAHFLRTFKKITGLAPSNYREKYCWM